MNKYFIDQSDLSDQSDQTVKVNRGSLESSISESQENTPKDQKSSNKSRISKHRRHSNNDGRPYDKFRKSTMTSETSREEIVNINPSNYVQKNNVTQSYSVISQQRPTNTPPKFSNGDADYKRPPIMIKSYDIHPNNQFGFMQISDSSVQRIKGTVEISINNEQFYITRPEIIKEISVALDDIFERNLSKDEFKAIELNSGVIMKLGKYQNI